MNIKDYISSGILEAYALGDLSVAERLEVEKNLERYPELRAELLLIEDTQEAMMMKLAVKPHSKIREEIFRKIDNKPEVKVVSIQDNSHVWRFAAAASFAIALISSYLAYNYWSKWKSSELSLNNLIAQNQHMAQDYNQVNQRIDKIEKDMKVMGDPSFTRVVMKGTPNAPEALAQIYWNEKTQEVYLSIKKMKELSKENQYQLWALIDGKPVDAGVFDGNLAGLIKMKSIGKGATTFAVTIEPRGGKPSPSLETMQVAGNITKG